jgi:hypothetical protein
MPTIAMETWLHSGVPSKKPSLADVFLTSLGPLTGADLIELNPASTFSRRMSQLHLHLISIGSQTEVRSTSILNSYPPVPSASAVAFNASDNRSLASPGPFLQRTSTPGVDIVNTSIVLSEAQQIPAAEARERSLFTVLQNEQALTGLCFSAVVANGGCTDPDCRFCKQSPKLLSSRNADACERTALRVVGHSVAQGAKADGGDRQRDRSRSRDRDDGRDRSASRDRDGGGGDRRRSVSAGRR